MKEDYFYGCIYIININIAFKRLEDLCEDDLRQPLLLPAILHNNDNEWTLPHEAAFFKICSFWDV